MTIIDARWMPRHNELGMRCDCGAEWWHRADRWVLRCPTCGVEDDLMAVRHKPLDELHKKYTQSEPVLSA